MGILGAKKILVTGGGGFLGSAIVKKLLNQGENVVSFSRNFYPKLEKLGVEQIQGDISDKNAVENACKDIDLIFHTAAKPGVWGSYSDFFNTNVIGTSNIISACFKHDILRFIYTSSPSVIFNGKNMENVDESVSYPEKFHAFYPKTKALAEQLVLKASKNGLKTIILRPHLIWGPEDNHLVPRIIERADSLKIVGDGKNLVDTIYIDNAAHAHILAAKKLKTNPELSGKIYFISQDDPISLWEMVNAILKAGKKQPVKHSISQKTAFIAGALLEFIYKTFHLKGEPKMTRFVAQELATSHWFNISAAKKELGYFPQISTEQGLAELATWLRKS